MHPATDHAWFIVSGTGEVTMEGGKREKVEPGLSRRVLSELTRVAGWFRDDWHQIHEIVVAPPSGT